MLSFPIISWLTNVNNYLHLDVMYDELAYMRLYLAI